MKELPKKYALCSRLSGTENPTETAAYAMGELKLLYPEAPCALEFEGDPFRLLVMARLSAQCTDKRVNQVSKALFSFYPDAFAMAEAPLAHLEELVKSCGVYKVKAKNLSDMAKILVQKTDGRVPPDRDFLLSLPGVGPKIANLILGDVFSIPGIVADTHCIRLANRLGFVQTDDPVKVEKTLSRLIPPEEQSDFCHRAVMFGREFCSSQNPKCDACPLAKHQKGNE